MVRNKSRKIVDASRYVSHIDCMKEFNEANKAHDEAERLYLKVINNHIDKAGSCMKLARLLKLPESTLRTTAKIGGYLSRRKLAHAIMKAVGK